MIKMLKISPFIIAISLFGLYLLLTVEPKGFCSGQTFNGKTNVYLTDEEFIFATLKVTPGVYTEGGDRVVNPSDAVIKSYMKKHPECCRVFRDEFSSNGVSEVRNDLVSRVLGIQQTVVVAYRDVVLMKINPTFMVKGTPVFMIEGNSVSVSVCGQVYLD